jgi:hypothetical protein
MELTPGECALYAQVVPVFVLAAVAAMRRWEGRAGIAFFSMAIGFGGMASWVALLAAKGGTGPVAGTFIAVTAGVCIALVTGTAALYPYADKMRAAGDAAAAKVRRRRKVFRMPRHHPHHDDERDDEGADGQ